MKRSILRTLLRSAILLTAAALPIAANQSQILKTTVEGLNATGSAREIYCRLRIFNPNPIAVTVNIPAVDSRFGYQVNASPDSLSISPRGEGVVEVRISISADGKYQVLVPLDLTNARGRPIGDAKKDLYFRVTRGRYAVSNFRELFVQPIAIETDSDGERLATFRTGPPPAGWPNSPDFDPELPTIEELEALRRETVFETDWSGADDDRRRGTKWSSLASGSAFQNAFPAGIRAADKIMSPASPNGATFTARGKLVYTGQDGMLHPAWGWRVYVYAIIAGSWVKIGKTNAKGDGNWEIELPWINFPIRIKYQPRNYFFSFADISENAWYSFTSGSIYNVGIGGTINEYTQAVYSANSDLIHLGELHRDGMKMLSALANKGGGIAPEREESIVVYYPNDEEECNHDEPWSCSSEQGFIWLIPEHAAGRAVMIHELTHQMHFEYWDNDLPGTTAPHPPFECTDKGQALTEGFADFVVHWVRFNRLTIRPETRPCLSRTRKMPATTTAKISSGSLPLSGTCTTRWTTVTTIFASQNKGRRSEFFYPTTTMTEWTNFAVFTSKRPAVLRRGSTTRSIRTIRIETGRGHEKRRCEK